MDTLKEASLSDSDEFWDLVKVKRVKGGGKPKAPIRIYCSCGGMEHKPLKTEDGLIMACLNCGNIICQAQGYGYCLFCGAPPGEDGMPVQMDVEFDVTRKIVGYELELQHRGRIDPSDVRGLRGEDGSTSVDSGDATTKQRNTEKMKEAENYALFMQQQVLINDQKATDIIDDQFDLAYYDQLVNGTLDQYMNTDDDTDSFYDY